MRQALILITAVLLIATSCKKKSPNENCYVFFISDTIYSDVYLLRDTTYDSVNHCGYTDDMRNLFIKQNSGVDTLKNKNDTLIISHMSSSWEFLN